MKFVKTQCLELPECLLQLICLAVKKFFSDIHYLVIRTLIRAVCLTKDDLELVTMLDEDRLKGVIADLMPTNYIASRMFVRENKKVVCYYVNYAQIVGSLKCVLFDMRKRIAGEQFKNRYQTTYYCNECGVAITQENVIRKFNKKKWNKAPCRNCGWIIDREEAKAKTNILIRMRTFNRQMNYLFKLMEEVEYSTIQIAADYLHPEPVDLSSITTGSGSERRFKNANYRPIKEMWRQQTLQRNYSNSNVIVVITDNDPEQDTEMEKIKPLIEYDNAYDESNRSFEMDGEEVLKEQYKSEPTVSSPTTTSNEIRMMLLKYENIDAESVPGQQSENTNNSEQLEILTSYEESENSSEPLNYHEPTITCGDRKFPISEVNECIIRQMNENEKSEYISVYQDYYSYWFE